MRVRAWLSRPVSEPDPTRPSALPRPHPLRESAHLTTGWMSKLNAFQLRGLRKILRMLTTYVDRRNTNDVVLQRADAALGKGKRLRLFSEHRDQARVKLAAHLLRRDDLHPGRFATYEMGSAEGKENPHKRVGRPKTQWAAGTHERAWRELADEIGEDEAPDPSSSWQQGWIHLMAVARRI